MASSSVPPAPPPPPPVQFAPKTLARSQRPPADRNNVGSVRAPSNAPNRSPLANIHPEALQHAAANLRKTQYREPLLASEPEQLLGRPHQLPAGGYRAPFAQHDPLAQHQAGAPSHVAHPNSYASVSLGNGRGYCAPLSCAGEQPARWTASALAAPAAPAAVPKPNINNNYSTTYSSSSSSSTTTTTNTNAYAPPPSSSYSYSSYSNYADTTAPPDYAPPPPPTHYQSPSMRTPIPPPPPQTYSNGSGGSYSTYSSTTTTTTTTNNNNNGTRHPDTRYTATYIPNPQQYIHNFATQNFVETTPDPSDFSAQQIRRTPQPSGPKSYAEQLRDSTLTDRQKFANQFQRSALPERLPPQAVAHIYQESTAETQRQLSQRRQPNVSGGINEVDDLIKDMELRMRATDSFANICFKCEKEIQGDPPGVTALGKAYHVTCFLCDQCQKQLAGCSFYNVDGKHLCQVDYMNSLDKCDKCATPITQKILRAMGRAFHPDCFTCPSCAKSLDGIPFTVDPQGTPFCLDCYHERFSPRCNVCLKAIVPPSGQTEVARIVAMDRSYHVECYKCEDCGMQLNSKVEGQGCYPIETHLFCKNCNIKRLKAMH